jgi:calcium permeable stress-gated cation channel
VLPSQYYKLRGVHGLTGGRFAGSRSLEQVPSFSESVQSRVVGSRFQEMEEQEFGRYGALPQSDVGEHGEFLGDTASWNANSDPRAYRPNYSSPTNEDRRDAYGSSEHGSRLATLPEEEDWVDIEQERTPNMQSEDNGPRGSMFRRPRLNKKESARRETFPFRKRDDVEEKELPPPPHLRVQHSQPFVRPNDGVDYDNLGEVYNGIQYWRSRLKAINAQVSEAQIDSYSDIAEGNRVKGWLMVGKGLRHLNKMQLIEGRAKEDIRWDVLQNERTALDSIVLWAVVAIVTILLAVGRKVVKSGNRWFTDTLLTQ